MNALFLAVGLLTAAPAFAQHSHQSMPHGSQSHTQSQHGHSPYIGMEDRAIKALSEQQVADIRAGKGMSLALPAELNGYPGPLHTLEHASELKLDDAQIAKTKELFNAMQQEAKAAGERLIGAEKELDELFKRKLATLDSIQSLTANAARLQGELRASHLRYHLTMAQILTPAQISHYKKLRGYQ